MTPRLSFFGAAGTVTGSCFHVEHSGGRFLVDCGMFQGSKTLRELNYGPFPFDPTAVDFVLLTHAHIDHSGLVPKLVKAGFRGPVFTTSGTRDLLTFMLPDSGYIQETDVERLNRRNRQRGRDTVTPIYTRADAEASLQRLRAVEYEDWIVCGPKVRARYWNAGHILGSASIEIEIEVRKERRPLRLLFSGDLGPDHKLFHPVPTGPAELDYVILEGTYGDRDRPAVSPAGRREMLRQEVLTALERGGNLLVPAFAIERTQELLLDLAHLFASGAIPAAHVFIDSPLAIRATEVFAAHAHSLEDVTAVPAPFKMPNFHFLETVEQSMAAGRIESGAIILAASGMCEAGRIRHHLKQHLWRSNTTVLFVGYQAPGTLGQVLIGGAKSVRIHGEEVTVRAAIRSLDVYSGHADRAELLAWMRERLPIRSGVFLVHGEGDSLRSLRSALLAERLPPDRVLIPQLDETFLLVAGGPPREAEGPRRLPQRVVDRPDWHNAYAALVLDLQHALQERRSDRDRELLIARLRQVLQDHRESV
jgi:metallo-beta-lactamase family protein